MFNSVKLLLKNEWAAMQADKQQKIAWKQI